LLYSDIKPDYYARLGYQLCPAHRGTWELSNDRQPVATDWLLERTSGERSQSTLAELYAADRGCRALSIERSPEYWQHLGARRPGDEFYLLRTPQCDVAGYARVTITSASVVLGDRALSPQFPDAEEQLYRALAQLAHARGCRAVEGWLPDSPAARQFFTLVPRTIEITMLKSLAGGPQLDAAAIAATDFFCEIDHF